MCLSGKQCKFVIKTAVKKWMPNRKKLAKGKPIANHLPTTAAAVVQERLDMVSLKIRRSTVKSSPQLLKNWDSHQKLKV